MIEDTNTAINPENVTTGGPVEGACIYVNFGDDVTLPETATESLVGEGSEWENAGELSDQGWTTSTSATVNKFKGHHGSTLLTESANEEVTLKLECTEVVRPTVCKMRYGVNNVTMDGTGFVTAIDPTVLPGQILPIVIDSLFSNGIIERAVFPRAKVENVDDEAHQRGSLHVYGMTFSLLVDEEGRPYYKRRARLAAATTDGEDEDNNG